MSNNTIVSVRDSTFKPNSMAAKCRPPGAVGLAAGIVYLVGGVRITPARREPRYWAQAFCGDWGFFVDRHAWKVRREPPD